MTTTARATYTLYPVPADVADRVEALWTLDTEDVAGWVEYTWPKVQHDILFVGGTCYRRTSEGVVATVSDAAIEAGGLGTRRYEHGPRNRLTGVRLRPGCLPLPGVSAHELRSAVTCMADLDPIASSSVWCERNPELRVRELVRWLRRRMPVRGAHGDQLTRAFEARVAVRAVASSLGVSERSLRRHCHEHFGLSPVELRRLLRFRRAACLLDGSHDRFGFSAVHSAGYADQAHFSRECRALTGQPPKFWWPVTDSFKRG